MLCALRLAGAVIGGWARSSGTFFPQFLPRHGPVFGTTLALAFVQLILDTSYCVGVVLLASRARRWLSRAAVRRRLERMLGAALVALGIDLAAASR